VVRSPDCPLIQFRLKVNPNPKPFELTMCGLKFNVRLNVRYAVYLMNGFHECPEGCLLVIDDLGRIPGDLNLRGGNISVLVLLTLR
jgi:hypothetical protein